jgi:hypothetical protein
MFVSVLLVNWIASRVTLEHIVQSKFLQLSNDSSIIDPPLSHLKTRHYFLEQTLRIDEQLKLVAIAWDCRSVPKLYLLEPWNWLGSPRKGRMMVRLRCLMRQAQDYAGGRTLDSVYIAQHFSPLFIEQAPAGNWREKHPSLSDHP